VRGFARVAAPPGRIHRAPGFAARGLAFSYAVNPIMAHQEMGDPTPMRDRAVSLSRLFGAVYLIILLACLALAFLTYQRLHQVPGCLY